MDHSNNTKPVGKQFFKIKEGSLMIPPIPMSNIGIAFGRFSKYYVDPYSKQYDEYMINFDIENKLDDFISNDDIIDMTGIQEELFKNIDCDIFICHSYKDKEIAKEIAGYILNNTDKKPFVDSTIWDNVYTLLKKIDDDVPNQYCVYTILSAALIQMIQKCNTFLFIESNNSVSNNKNIITTESPWIYHEIITAKSIYESIRATESIQKHFSYLTPQYRVNLSFLNEIRLDALINILE